jgi:hypothetical protein
MSARDAILALGKRIGQSIIGQEAMVERLPLGCPRVGDPYMARPQIGTHTAGTFRGARAASPQPMSGNDLNRSL